MNTGPEAVRSATAAPIEWDIDRARRAQEHVIAWNPATRSIIRGPAKWLTVLSDASETARRGELTVRW